MPTLFPVVEAMTTPPIRRTQAIRTSTTTVHPGPKRAVRELSSRIQVLSAHGQFGPVDSDSILSRVRPATLVTLASEHNGHSDLDPINCVANTSSLMCVFL